MITVTKQMRTETGHRLMDYDGRCSHMHGHSYLWEVTATAPELDLRGMVVDFSDLKAVMVLVIDPLDHASVFRADDPMGEAAMSLPATNNDIQRVFQVNWNPTAENFAANAAKSMQALLDAKNEDITIIKVKVWETSTSFAEWRKEDERD